MSHFGTVSKKKKKKKKKNLPGSFNQFYLNEI